MSKKRVPVVIEGVIYFKCSKCQQLKPIELMMKSSNRPYGLGSCCKVCASLASSKSHAKKSEYYAAFNATYKKQWLKDNPNYYANYSAERRANDPIFKFKYEIRKLTNNAILRGNLTKASACSHCYSTENIEAHHPEYSLEKALDVIWLCRNCHRALHQSLNDSTEE